MQILGKRSKILLIAVAIFMLATLGLSFALWDTQAVKASSGNLIQYANAKVGDIVTFGRFYQSIDKDADGEYIKTPIEWIVVDKNERTGELTLMSKYILAAGCYFGNWYYDTSNAWGPWYDSSESVEKLPYSTAYAESTVRAFLNNSERYDMGGDGFDAGIGYVPSKFVSEKAKGKLLASVGFSNKKYTTGLAISNEANKALIDAGNLGLTKALESDDIIFQRPINNDEYKARPAARGFYDEAFDEIERGMIQARTLPGYIGNRWPDANPDVKLKSYIDSTREKVWLPSADELNYKHGIDWTGRTNAVTPSDEGRSEAFEYFRRYKDFNFNSLGDAVKTVRTKLAENAAAANFSIPMYNKLKSGETALTVNGSFSATKNTADGYWTRSPYSNQYRYMCTVNSGGAFSNNVTDNSYLGVRPCLILKY